MGPGTGPEAGAGTGTGAGVGPGTGTGAGAGAGADANPELSTAFSLFTGPPFSSRAGSTSCTAVGAGGEASDLQPAVANNTHIHSNSRYLLNNLSINKPSGNSVFRFQNMDNKVVSP